MGPQPDFVDERVPGKWGREPTAFLQKTSQCVLQVSRT